MKKRTRMYQRMNMFYTLLLSTILPCVLATVMLALVFVPMMKSVSESTDEAYGEVLLSAVGSRMESVLDIVEDQKHNFLKVEWLHRLYIYHLIGMPLDFEMKEDVISFLSRIVADNPEVYSVAFQFYDDPATIYSSSGIFMDISFLQEIAPDSVYYRFFEANATEAGYKTVEHGGNTYLLYFMPFPHTPGGRDKGVLNILLRHETVGKDLTMASENHGRRFALQEGDREVWSYGFGTGDAVTLYRPLGNSDLTLSMELPRQIVTRTSSHILSRVSLTLAVSLLVSAILSYLLSCFTYRPIQMVVEQFVEDKTTGNELLDLQNVFEKLVDEKSLAEASLAQLRPIAHQKMLGAMLDGSAFLGDSEDQMENCGIRFAYEQFNVIALEAPFSQLKDTPAAELAAEILSEALSSQLPLKAYLYYENSDQYRIVLNYDSWDDLQAYLSLLTSNIKQYFWNQDVPSGVYVGVGQAVSAPEELYRSAEQADTAVYMAILNRLDQPMFYREMAPELNYEYFYPMSEELLLSRAVTNGNLASAKSVLYSVLEENRKNAGLNPKCLQFLYMDLSSTVARSGQSLGVRTLSLDSREGYISLDEIGSRVEQMIDHICGQIMEKRSKSVTPTEQKVLDYIDSHLFDPNLSLNSVGEAFQISPGYVSNIFRAHRDTNFNNYVNQMRIMRAIQIMTEEGLDSASVYPQVGYTNLTTFRRNFIKFAKHSPGQTLSVDGENDEE